MNQYYFNFLLLIAVCGIGCNQSTPSSTPSTAKESSPYSVAPIDAASFDAHRGDTLQNLLIQQFCEESKGYQKGTWIGLNKCSWAIEKYRLDQAPDVIQRNGDELSIILKNGSKASFIHQQLESEQPILYQLKKYLPQIDYALIKKTNGENCAEHLFVRLSDGAQTVIAGTPFITPDEKNFILNGATDQLCHSTLEYWTLSADQIKQQWHSPLTNGALKEVKWLDNKTFFSSIAENQSKENTQYHKYSIH